MNNCRQVKVPVQILTYLQGQAVPESAKTVRCWVRHDDAPSNGVKRQGICMSDFGAKVGKPTVSNAKPYRRSSPPVPAPNQHKRLTCE